MWEQPVSIISYLLVAGLVVFLSMKLSDFVDLLDKKTKISGAFLGGILLAAVTSLPELFTSLSSTIFIHENQYVMGNILGSDLFNVCLFAIVYLFFFKKFISSKVSKTYLISLIFLGLMYISVVLAVFVFNANNILLGGIFNPISIVIFIIYAISLWKMPKEEESEDKETESKLTVKQLIILFILFSLLLIGASIGVTFLTDWVVASFSISSKTFAGALFLGVATSLPELTSTVNLCKKRNFNACYGNIIGSNVFNFLILFFADCFSGVAGKPLYAAEYGTTLLIIFGSITVIFMFLAVILKSLFEKKQTIGRIFYYSISIIYIGLYVSFLVLSNL